MQIRSLAELCCGKLSYIKLMWIEDCIPVDLFIIIARRDRIAEVNAVCGKIVDTTDIKRVLESKIRAIILTLMTYQYRYMRKHVTQTITHQYMRKYVIQKIIPYITCSELYSIDRKYVTFNVTVSNGDDESNFDIFVSLIAAEK